MLSASGKMAGDETAWRDLTQFGCLLEAALLRIGATACKAAPSGRLTGLGTSPLRMILCRQCRRGGRNGGEQRLGIGVKRICENIAIVAQLHNFTQIHDANAVADVLDNAQIVRNEQISESEILLQADQQIDDLCLNTDIQRGYRLVEHDEIGVDGKRTAMPTR